MRTWSKQKDGLGFYYSTDGKMPMLNVRLENVGGLAFWWVAYCGDDLVPTGGASKQAAQVDAERYWERTYAKEGTEP